MSLLIGRALVFRDHGRKKERLRELGSVQLSRFGKAGRNLRRNPKGREGEISEAWKTKSLRQKSDRAKDI